MNHIRVCAGRATISSSLFSVFLKTQRYIQVALKNKNNLAHDYVTTTFAMMKLFHEDKI